MHNLYKRSALAMIASLLFALLTALPAVAQEDVIQADVAQEEVAAPTPGINRETAGPNLAGRVEISGDERQWYKFRYVFDQDSDDEPGNAIVSLKMDQAGCVSFEVTTSGRLDFPYEDDGTWVGPIGRGTPFDNGVSVDPLNLVWVGGGRFSETHYVIVRHHGDTPCSYTLSISGDPVVF